MDVNEHWETIQLYTLKSKGIALSYNIIDICLSKNDTLSDLTIQ